MKNFSLFALGPKKLLTDIPTWIWARFCRSYSLNSLTLCCGDRSCIRVSAFWGKSLRNMWSVSNADGRFTGRAVSNSLPLSVPVFSQLIFDVWNVLQWSTYVLLSLQVLYLAETAEGQIFIMECLIKKHIKRVHFNLKYKQYVSINNKLIHLKFK